MANIEIRQETPTAFYIKVHDTDNVAIIVNDNGLKAGTRFPDGLELIEHIPQGHKVALLDIPANGEIIRYGEVIGYAVRAIPRGSWIDESMVVLPEAPPLHTLPLATKVPEPLPPLEGYTFEGYRNADGSDFEQNIHVKRHTFLLLQQHQGCHCSPEKTDPLVHGTFHPAFLSGFRQLFLQPFFQIIKLYLLIIKICLPDE